MQWIESTKEIWGHTMELAWQLDRAGTPLALPDLHIASCALSIGAVILTHDKHFKRIPGVVATDRMY
jgi:predicted nucleic acid-binding protein